jgi:N-acetylglucosamine repressor
MRRINPHDFYVANRSTSRNINRSIALNLIREHHPISRADLARRMDVARNVVTFLVNDLISDGLIYEGATGQAARGRKPTLLHVRTRHRLIIAVDIRFSQTHLMLTDFSGVQIALEGFDTIFSPAQLVEELAGRIAQLLKKHQGVSQCEGIGVAVPGVVDYPTERILNAPTLGWRNVDLREPLAAATGLPVHIENAAKTSALAQMWHGRNDSIGGQNFAFVSVSDGIGVGIVINGELLRGVANMAGEFGHTPLSLDGPRPRCMCGATGCWQAYASNIATLSRYFKRDLSKIKPQSLVTVSASSGTFTIADLVNRARLGESRALDAIQLTGRYIGLGLATIVNALNPAQFYISGEITLAWDLIEDRVRTALSERSLIPAAVKTPIQTVAATDYPRLRGAAALVAAPTFAAPRVA